MCIKKEKEMENIESKNVVNERTNKPIERGEHMTVLRKDLIDSMKRYIKRNAVPVEKDIYGTERHSPYVTATFYALYAIARGADYRKGVHEEKAIELKERMEQEYSIVIKKDMNRFIKEEIGEEYEYSFKKKDSFECSMMRKLFSHFIQKGEFWERLDEDKTIKENIEKFRKEESE